MHISIYADPDSRPFQRLQNAIALVDLDRPPEVHGDIDRFCECFRTVSYNPDLVIIMPTCPEELVGLAAARDLFASIRTIVILPEREKPIISMGHLFHPSFIAFDDDTFFDVAAILKHLCKHPHCPQEAHLK